MKILLLLPIFALSLALGCVRVTAPLTSPARYQVFEIEELDLLAIVTDRFALSYPKGLSAACPIERVAECVDDALDLVDRTLPLDQGNLISVAVVERIDPAVVNYPPSAVILGYPCKIDDTFVIVLAREGLTQETISHEVAHLRLMQLDLDVPLWLHEGIAHWYDTSGKANERMVSILRKYGPEANFRWPQTNLTEAEWLNAVTRCRASAWLVVYYLTEHKGLTMREVAELPEQQMPNAEEAWRVIERELRVPTTDPSGGASSMPVEYQF